MDIIISNSSEQPIYEQITAQIKAQILSGELAAGEMLPSMRKLALELHISLITTKRAYGELEEQGFIETCAGKGCFVKAQNAQLVREEHLKQIEGLFGQALDRAKLSGITLPELREMLELLWEERGQQ
ncbi:MAG: GntR family transcriptional regulator [Acetatifactor sp.]